MAIGKCYATGSLDPSDYNILSHGDAGAFYNSVSNADLPEYTIRFYQPSHQETMADLKYDKMEIGYDKGLRSIRDSVHGAPMEAYIPRSVVVPDNGSACPAVVVRNPEVMPKRTVVEEILRAQAEVTGKKESREPVIIRTIEIEQELHLWRKFRKVEIIKNHTQDNK